MSIDAEFNKLFYEFTRIVGYPPTHFLLGHDQFAEYMRYCQRLPYPMRNINEYKGIFLEEVKETNHLSAERRG